MNLAPVFRFLGWLLWLLAAAKQRKYHDRIEAANKIEEYLNEATKTQDVVTFTYFEIAEHRKQKRWD